MFWPDLIASLPIDNFLVMFGTENQATDTLGAMDLIKLGRIFRLGRIIRFTRARDDVKGLMNLL